MPYVEENGRAILAKHLSGLCDEINKHALSSGIDKLPGIVNYAIVRIIGGTLRLDSYASINSAIGILECAKLELYRRIAAPYEDKKAEENGDVF